MTPQTLRVLSAAALCAFIGACDTTDAPRDDEARAWHIDAAYAVAEGNRYEVTVHGAPTILDVAPVEGDRAVAISEPNAPALLWGYSEDGTTVLLDPETGEPFEIDPQDPYQDLALAALSDAGLPAPENFRGSRQPLPTGGLPTQDNESCRLRCESDRQTCDWMNSWGGWLNRDRLIEPCDLQFDICIDHC